MPSAFILWGMGGIGKTQLAFHYAQEQSGYYGSQLWIDGTTERTLSSGYKEIATERSSADWAGEGQCTIVTETVSGQWTWIPQDSAPSEGANGHDWNGHTSVNATLTDKPPSLPHTHGSPKAAQTEGLTGQDWPHPSGLATGTSVTAASDTTDIETESPFAWEDWSTPADPASTSAETWDDWFSPSDAAYTRTETWGDWSTSVESLGSRTKPAMPLHSTTHSSSLNHFLTTRTRTNSGARSSHTGSESWTSTWTTTVTVEISTPTPSTRSTPSQPSNSYSHSGHSTSNSPAPSYVHTRTYSTSTSSRPRSSSFSTSSTTSSSPTSSTPRSTSPSSSSSSSSTTSVSTTSSSTTPSSSTTTTTSSTTTTTTPTITTTTPSSTTTTSTTPTTSSTLSTTTFTTTSTTTSSTLSTTTTTTTTPEIFPIRPTGPCGPYVGGICCDEPPCPDCVSDGDLCVLDSECCNVGSTCENGNADGYGTCLPPTPTPPQTTGACPTGVQAGPTTAAGSRGCTYDVLCGRSITALAAYADTVSTDFDACLTFCDDNACYALEYHEDTGVCILYDSSSQATATKASGTDEAATLVSCGPAETS
ncbi:uncharacterized protein PV07_03873 [Cladophialophora immunda]|uniref:Apple domain-containing protein n=1 Tax=Cladophialophora immunda TaxID=569365 RepID=A0A0D2D9C0_9EURO|nr:uncharacterized protein PV07_03873 [Cladophialophora immunda]KIW32319.1 hypothetical protein PV07_03873 [Cladophialophora immunda]